MAHTTPPNIHSLIGKINAQQRWHPDSDTTELEQDLAVARVITHALKALEVAPALTDKNIADIVAVLKAGA